MPNLLLGVEDIVVNKANRTFAYIIGRGNSDKKIIRTILDSENLNEVRKVVL